MVLPLSNPQRVIWYEQKLFPGLPLYNIGGYLKINGPLDVEKFSNVVCEVAGESDILSVRFTEDEGVPSQHFGAWEVQPPRLLDFSASPDPEEACEKWMHSCQQEPFDLFTKPLYLFAILKASDTCYFWYVKLHHLLTDGYGISLIVNRAVSAYNGDGSPAAFRYADYAEDNRQYLESPSFAKDEVYWKEKFSDFPVLLNPGCSVLPEKTAESGRKKIYIPRESYNRLLVLAQESQVTVFHVLLSALYAYLSRARGVEDIVIGLPVLNRGKAAYKKTVGLFAGMIPFRVQAGSSLSLAELAAQIRNGLREAYKYQQYPVDEIYRMMRQADPSRNFLFEVTFSYEKHDYDVQVGEWPTEKHVLAHHSEKLPLALYVREYDEVSDVLIDIDYNQSFWDEFYISSWVADFEALLASLPAQFHRSVAALDVLAPFARKLQLEDFRGADKDYPLHRTVLDLFSIRVQEYPDLPAAVSGQERLSYRELDEQSDRIASFLRAEGLTPGSCVGFTAEPCTGMISGLLGILKAGASFLPMDPAYPQKRLRFLLEDAGAAMLLSTTPLTQISGMPFYTVQEALGFPGEVRYTRPSVSAEDTAYVVYTSGSTGEPKGIRIPHRALTNLCCWFNEYYSLTSEDATGKYASFGFDASVFEIFPFLTAGAAVHMVPPGIRLDMEKLDAFYEQSGISITFLPTPVCEQFMEQEGRSLRVLFTGGDRLKKYIPRSYKLYNNYGPAENTVVATAGEVTSPVIPVGKPVSNQHILLLGRNGELLPFGSTGEICIGGTGLAKGYINRPEEESRRFLPHPLSAGELLYRTGDRARWLPDGSLQFAGRDDEQVKIRGNRVELAEVEARLLRHPAVRQCVVTACGKEGDTYLAAYLAGDTDEQSIRSWLLEELPAFMMPASITILPALPLNTSGKVDKSSLPASGPVKAADRVEPSGPVEQAVAEVWAEVLNAGQISARDNFFSLGGDSIKAIQIASRLRSRNLVMDVKDIFEHPSVQQLASRLKPLSTSVSGQAYEGLLPLLPGQLMVAGSSAKPLLHAVLLECIPELEAHQLEAALNAVIDGQDALRCSFSNESGELQQYCHPAGSCKSSLIISEHSASFSAALIPLLMREAEAGMSLEHPPLLNARLIRTPGTNYLFLALHPLVSDAASVRILVEDLERACREAVKVIQPVVNPAYSLYSYSRERADREKSSRLLSLIPGTGDSLNASFESTSVVGFSETIHIEDSDAQRLLNEVHPVFSTDTGDILLSALIRTLESVFPMQEPHIALQSHERASSPQAGMSRMLGCLDVLCRVRFRMQEDIALLVKEVKEEVRRHISSGHGAAYGTACCIASFRYEEAFENPGEAVFSVAELRPVPPPGEYAVSVFACLANGKLMITFSFSSSAFNEQTGSDFTEAYRNQLHKIISYCISRTEKELTPSDYGDTALTLDELDNILGQINEL
jgi:amino acid adenylation domain-containing protein